MTQAISLEERLKRVELLDLGPIMFKLVHEEGLDLKEVQGLEERYKRFLTLQLKHPDKKIVPSKEIDAFWHAHILDTQKYAEDCEYLFGHFLHHFPYFGLRGQEDAQALQDAFQETRDLYYLEFGENLRNASDCVAACDAAQCNPATCHNISDRPTINVMM